MRHIKSVLSFLGIIVAVLAIIGVPAVFGARSMINRDHFWVAIGGNCRPATEDPTTVEASWTHTIRKDETIWTDAGESLILKRADIPRCLPLYGPTTRFMSAEVTQEELECLRALALK